MIDTWLAPCMVMSTPQVPTSRPATDYTVRVVPYHPDAIVPLEAAQILWQR